jgi:hypothetical protein
MDRDKDPTLLTPVLLDPEKYMWKHKKAGGGVYEHWNVKGEGCSQFMVVDLETRVIACRGAVPVHFTNVPDAMLWCETMIITGGDKA